jgi:hypothetical protein
VPPCVKRIKPAWPYDILTTVSLFYLLQCIIPYDHRTSCNAPLAARPQAQQASLHLDSDGSQGVSPYLVRNADGACCSHVPSFSTLSTFLAQVSLARLKLKCDRKVRVLVNLRPVRGLRKMSLVPGGLFLLLHRSRVIRALNVGVRRLVPMVCLSDVYPMYRISICADTYQVPIQRGEATQSTWTVCAGRPWHTHTESFLLLTSTQARYQHRSNSNMRRRLSA